MAANTTTGLRKKRLAYGAIFALAVFALWTWENTNTPVLSVEQSVAVSMFSSDKEARTGLFSFGTEKHPDLQIRILETGVLDDSQEFLEGDTFKSGEMGIIRVEIRNIGELVSEKWKLTATLPTTPPFTYTSKERTPLKPHDSVTLRLSFDSLETAFDQKLSVVVETENDADLENNSFQQVVQVVD